MLEISAKSHSTVLYLLLEHPLLFLEGNAIVVLDGDHDGVNPLRDHGSVFLVVMHSHLRHRRSQRIKSEKENRQVTVPPHLSVQVPIGQFT